MSLLNSVELWFFDNEKLSQLSYDWGKNLSTEEQQRAHRFHFESDQRSFMIYHSCKRLILSCHLNKEPKDIVISFQEKGKPFLKDEPLTFNLSHTKEMAVLAVANGVEIGVDIEKIKTSANYLDIAKRFFHPDEYQQLMEFEDAQQQQQQFYILWTAKEAILKATGEGIAAGLNKFSVQQHLSNLDELKHTYPETITLMPLSVPDNYVATLAIVGEKRPLIYREFSVLD